MMNLEELIEFADTTISCKRGRYLSDLEKIILRECCQDKTKTYDRIARESGYSDNYLKKKVVPQLWQRLSETFEEKVTKANCLSILQGHRESVPKVQRIKLESPEGQVPLGSPFYIDRSALEQSCYEEILEPGALVRLEGPQKIGKTSLLARILADAERHEYHTVRLSLDRAGRQVLASEDKFCRWLCANATRQLGLETDLDASWDEDIGSLTNCCLYFEKYILAQIEHPIVLALDEVNCLFEYPAIAGDFLGIVRSWYKDAKDCSLWQKLRTVLSYSTNPCIPSDINKLLNIGFLLELPPFSRLQVQELTVRHHLQLSSSQLTQVQFLLGGFPYLVRQLFYQVPRYSFDLNELMASAATDRGIFSYHLQEQLQYLQENSDLFEVYQQVVAADTPVSLEQKQAFGLKSLGLVRLEKNRVVVSCGLYRQYFREQLGYRAKLGI